MKKKNETTNFKLVSILEHSCQKMRETSKFEGFFICIEYFHCKLRSIVETEQ